jgi:hypothetical protein
MKINFLKTHRVRAITLFVVILVGILATLQQLRQIQDSRQRAASDVTVQLSSIPEKLQIGQRFSPNVIIDNKAGKQINSFDVTIAFDPQYVDFLQVLPAPPFQLIKTDTNKDLGTIRIVGIVDGNKTVNDYGSSSSARLVALLTFAAKKITPVTAISFANADIAALDDTKNVTGTIIGTKFAISNSGPTPTTPAPSKPYSSITPTPSVKPTQCKTGVNSLTTNSTNCRQGHYRLAYVTCYDGYKATVNLGYCMSKITLDKQTEKVCSGRTSCSPKYSPTPTPAPVVSCDINRDRVINKNDYNTLLNCVVGNSGYNCNYSALNNDGKLDAVDVNIYLRSCGSLLTPTPTAKIIKH